VNGNAFGATIFAAVVVFSLALVAWGFVAHRAGGLTHLPRKVLWVPGYVYVLFVLVVFVIAGLADSLTWVFVVASVLLGALLLSVLQGAMAMERSSRR